METCKYVFGEFSPDEFFDPIDPENGEFFLGFKDCSIPFIKFDCEEVFIYPKPYIESQREIDYNLLFNYFKKDLLANTDTVFKIESIGVNAICDIYFGIKIGWLINYMLLFKEELELNPTINNYSVLFNKYKLLCIDKALKKEYKKYNYIRDTLSLLKIRDLLEQNNSYQFDSSTNYINNESLNYIPNL